MNKLLVIASIASVALSYFSHKEEPPRYRQVYYNHTVQYGEGIHDIAHKYIDLHAGNDYPRFVFIIKHQNGLLDGRKLRVGEEILIPCLKEVK